MYQKGSVLTRADEDRGELLRYVRQRWGAKALRLATEDSPPEVLPTGLPALDGVLGGGLPAGRITELRCAPTSGAASVAHSLVAATQRRERAAVHLDAARSYDPAAAARAGVDFSRLTIVRPGGPREALAAAATLARSGGFDLIVFDRLTAGYGDSVLSTWLGCMAPLLHRERTAMLLMCAAREGGGAYYGGAALAHLSTLSLAARRVGWRRGGSGSISGVRLEIRVAKSKLGAPGGRAELELPTGTLATLRSLSESESESESGARADGPGAGP